MKLTLLTITARSTECTYQWCNASARSQIQYMHAQTEQRSR